MKVYLNKNWSTHLAFAPAGTELVLSKSISGCPYEEYRLVDPITKEFITGISEMEIRGNKNGMFRILEEGPVLEGKSNLMRQYGSSMKEIDKVFLEEDYRSEKHFVPKGTELKPTSGPHIFALYDKDVLVTKIDMFHNTNPMFKAIYVDKYYKFAIPPKDILMSGFIIDKDRTKHTSICTQTITEECYRNGLWFNCFNDAEKFLKFQKCRTYVNKLIDHCNNIYPIKHDGSYATIGFSFEKPHPNLIINCYCTTKMYTNKAPILANAESGQLFRKLFDPKWLETFREMWFDDKF